MKKIKLLITGLVLMLSFIAPPLTTTALAVNCTQSNLTTQEALQCGTNGTNGQTNASSDQTTQATNSFNNILTTFLNILSVFVGIVAVIMIVLAGFKFVTSGGNQEGVKSAKNSLVYAVVGLIVVALAQIIVQFVLDKTINAKAAKTPTSSTQSPASNTTPSSTNQNSGSPSSGGSTFIRQ